jgi:hypothetical protein
MSGLLDIGKEAAMTEWTQDSMGAWTCRLHGWSLWVDVDPDDDEHPWVWRAFRAMDEFDEEDADIGGTVTREEAMAEAEAVARNSRR